MSKVSEPAFPVSTSGVEGHQDGPNTWQFPGLSIRDYFAAKAMQAWLNVDLTRPGDNYLVDVYDFAAKQAFLIADAMLKEREK
jgi:hypothetical protein